MTSHQKEPPIEVEGVPAEEDVNMADVAEDLELEPEEKQNYTERQPERFQDPPGHVRELREGDEATDG